MLFSGPFIGKCLELYGQYSESEVAMMRNFAREGSTVVDVGANIGDLTLPLSNMVGETGRVLAIESNPETFNVLCANLALNSIRNVRPVNAFVAASDSVDTDGGDWGKFAYVGEVWEAQFISLDSLDPPACHLIKIDVDGRELEVLRSGEMIIEKHRPILYFENDVREASAPLLAYAMQTLGYDLYWHPAPIFDANNYRGNPVNHWAPNVILSLMMLAIPAEVRLQVPGLERVHAPDEWWRGL